MVQNQKNSYSMIFLIKNYVFFYFLCLVMIVFYLPNKSFVFLYPRFVLNLIKREFSAVLCRDT